MYLTPSMHVEYVWLLEAEVGNVLACLAREPGRSWLLQINPRIFVDELVLGSKDLRANTLLALDDMPLDVAVALCEDRLPKLAAVLLGPEFKRTRIDVHGDSFKAAELLNKHKSIHMSMPKGSPEA